jgi:hypothetical protein
MCRISTKRQLTERISRYAGQIARHIHSWNPKEAKWMICCLPNKYNGILVKHRAMRDVSPTSKKKPHTRKNVLERRGMNKRGLDQLEDKR